MKKIILSTLILLAACKNGPQNPDTALTLENTASDIHAIAKDNTKRSNRIIKLSDKPEVKK